MLPSDKKLTSRSFKLNRMCSVSNILFALGHQCSDITGTAQIKQKALRFNSICQATTNYSSENIKEELQWYPTRNMLIQPWTLQNLLEHYSDALILAVMMVLHAVGCVYVACFLYEWCKSMSILLFTRNFSLQTAVSSRLLVG